MALGFLVSLTALAGEPSFVGTAPASLDNASALAATDEKAQPAVIDAQELNFDHANNMTYGKGDCVIRYMGATVRADQAKYNTVTKEIWAEGHVRLNRDGQEWAAPAAYYNFQTGMFKADTARGVFLPVYLSGQQVSQVSSNHYTAARTVLTTCDYEEPHYRLQGTHAEIYPQDRIELYNCTLWIHNVPVLWLPKMTWSLVGDNRFFTITIGHTTDWGFFELSTTHFHLSTNLDVDVSLDERTKRGFGSGADLQYHYNNNTTGSIKGYYINDADPHADDDNSVGSTPPTNRFLGEWQHKEFFTDNLSLTVDLNKQSDSQMYSDFFPSQFNSDSEPTSIAELAQRGQNYTVSLLLQPQFNGFYAEVQRLPELKWDVNRTRIGPTPLFYEGESSVGYYDNRIGQTADPLFTGDSLRFDSMHQIVVPETLFGWLAVVPRAGAGYTYYQRAPDTASTSQDVNRVMADLGTAVSFKLSRTWSDIDNQRLGIDGLRHIFQPFADYNWVPSPNVKTNDLFQFDTIRSVTLTNGESLPVTRYVPLEYSGFNEVDAYTREDTLRFGLQQKLQTRRDGLPWDLLVVTAWTDYHIEKNEGEKDFSDLYGDTEARPADWLAFDTYERYDMQAGVLREFNTDMRISNHDLWTVGVGTRYLKDDSNQVELSLTYRLTRRWVAQAYERFEIDSGQWQEQSYMLRQETHDWFINYGFLYRNELTTQNEKAVFISVTLKAFPSSSLGINRVDVGPGN